MDNYYCDNGTVYTAPGGGRGAELYTAILGSPNKLPPQIFPNFCLLTRSSHADKESH